MTGVIPDHKTADELCKTAFPGNIASMPVRRNGRSRKLAHALVEAISESIRSCALRPGDKLPPEATIMAEHGVSRTVVREAITSLQTAGLIETRHGIGSFVRAVPGDPQLRIDADRIVTVRDVLAMLELRASLESESAALAAARRTDEQIGGMRHALDSFQANLASGGDTVGADFQFHLQIAYATGNRYFAEIMSHLGTATIPRTRINVVQNTAEYLAVVHTEHETILDAILRRDPEGARSAMRAHLNRSLERLRRAHDLANSGVIL